VPTDNFSFRRRIVNIALNNKPPKSKEQLKSKLKNTTNTSTINNAVKAAAKVSPKNSQQSAQRQNSKGPEPDVDDEATIKLTMPPVDEDEFDFGIIEELAGIGNINGTAKNSTNIQDASTLITTQRDTERKKSPSLSDDETTSGGSDRRVKVSPKKVELQTSTTLNVQSAARLSKSRGRSSPLAPMTDDSEDVIMKELEVEEEEVTQAKPRSRITRQASSVRQTVNSKSEGKVAAPKKKRANAESDGEPEEEKEEKREEKLKTKTRGRPKKEPPNKKELDKSVQDEPASEEEEKPKAKTR